MLQSRIILILGIVLMCHSGNVTAKDAVVVELHSGQKIRAQSIEPDAQSPGRIVLRVGNDQIKIRRSISWQRVNRLSAPTEMLATLAVPENVKVLDENLRQQVRELALTPNPDNVDANVAQVRSFVQPIPPPPAPDDAGVIVDGLASLPVPLQTTIGFGSYDPGVVVGVRDGCGGCTWMNHGGFTPAECLYRDPGVVVGIRDENPSTACATSLCAASAPGPMTLSVKQVPRELIVTARAFNRNGLADWNALEVTVAGRTAAGETCPVRGSLKCALWVRRAQLVRSYAEYYFEEPLDSFVLQRWSKFVNGSEIDANGVQKVILSLPPRSSDHSLNISQFGLLTVELDIPGQGRLATSTEPILLRQFGPIRARGVVDYGSTIFPQESVSEGLFDGGYWPEPLSGLRPDSRRFTVQP